MGATKQDFMDIRELELAEGFPEFYVHLNEAGKPEVNMTTVQLNTPSDCLQYMSKQLAGMADMEYLIAKVDNNILPSSVFNDVAYRENLVLNHQWYAEQHQYALARYTRLANEICSPKKFYRHGVQSGRVPATA